MLKNKNVQKNIVTLLVVLCIIAVICDMYFNSNNKLDENNKSVVGTEQNDANGVEKILDNAVLVTGGIFHAALLNDGTVWTWGYNPADNCGIADSLVVKTPTKVASDVIMVWSGRLQYNSDKYSLAGFDGEYPAEMMNTVIEKNDGSYWICGEGVGTEQKTVSGETEYTVTCSSKFVPYEFPANEFSK